MEAYLWLRQDNAFALVIRRSVVVGRLTLYGAREDTANCEIVSYIVAVCWWVVRQDSKNDYENQMAD